MGGEAGAWPRVPITAHPGGRHASEVVDERNRNQWTASAGMSGENASDSAPFDLAGRIRQAEVVFLTVGVPIHPKVCGWLSHSAASHSRADSDRLDRLLRN